MKEGSNDIYRALQKHLNKMPIGFPKSRDGSDIRVLQYLFTEDEAKVALNLDYLPRGLETIRESLGNLSISGEELEQTLDNMCKKGGITAKHKEDGWTYYLHPWVVGMSDMALITAWQDGRTTEPLRNMGNSFERKFFFNTIAIEQLMFRTIPISQSITPQHSIATYDEVRKIIELNEGKYVSIPCVCKTRHKQDETPCTKTDRLHTCMALKDNADMFVKNGIGSEITKEEALEIVQMNEKEGLVYQTENTQKPNYICGCCGDCCAILNILKLLPKPVDFARGNFQTSINKDLCIGCGTCVDRCQMNAITMIEKNNCSSVRIERCIGCGLCVPTCEGGAIQLKRRAQEEIPEEDRESYMNMIEANRKNWFQKVGRVLKLLFSRKIFHPFSGG